MRFINKLKWIRKRLSWNYKYAIGKWDYMGKEASRYIQIIRFIEETNILMPRILDLGCGYGSLYQYLDENTIEQYVGVDLSDTAIYKAKKKNQKKAHYYVADIQNFNLDQNFDIIVFNEVLYYLDNPIKSVARFDSNVSKNGFYIFSFFGEREDLKEKLSYSYNLIKTKSILVENDKRSWGISLFKIINKNK